MLIGSTLIDMPKEKSKTIKVKGEEVLVPVATQKEAHNAINYSLQFLRNWERQSPSLISLTLYRLYEIMQQYKEELVVEIEKTGVEKENAFFQLEKAIECVFFYAGWPDKIYYFISGVAPLPSPYHSISFPVGKGVCVILPCPKTTFSEIIGMMMPALATGNAVIVSGCNENFLPILFLGEVISGSDIPHGIINTLYLSDYDTTTISCYFVNADCIATDCKELYLAMKGLSAHYLPELLFLNGDYIMNWQSLSLNIMKKFVSYKTTCHPIELMFDNSISRFSY